MTDKILDLDALAPQPKKVKLGGKLLDVNPLTTEQLFKLIKSLSSIQTGKPDEEIEKVKDVLKEVIPEFGSVNLYVPQLMKLIEFMVTDAGLPKGEAIEAKKGGISDP